MRTAEKPQNRKILKFWLVLLWWELRRRGSNPRGTKYHWILSPARLPPKQALCSLWRFEAEKSLPIPFPDSFRVGDDTVGMCPARDWPLLVDLT
jgi:hypothetical protein